MHRVDALGHPLIAGLRHALTVTSAPKPCAPRSGGSHARSDRPLCRSLSCAPVCERLSAAEADEREAVLARQCGLLATERARAQLVPSEPGQHVYLRHL